MEKRRQFRITPGKKRNWSAPYESFTPEELALMRISGHGVGSAGEGQPISGWFWLFWGPVMGCLQYRDHHGAIYFPECMYEVAYWSAFGLCIYAMYRLDGPRSNKLDFWRGWRLGLLFLLLEYLSWMLVSHLWPRSGYVQFVGRTGAFAAIGILFYLLKDLANRYDKVRNTLVALRLCNESLCQ